MASLLRLAFYGILLALFVKILIDLDFNKVVFNHTPGKCEYIDGISTGSEDIAILSNGLAFISSGMLLRVPGYPYSNYVGKIYLYDVNKPAQRPINMQISGAKFYPAKFRPAGLSVWETKSKIILYTVNTYNQEIYVFEFNQEKKSLLFVKSFIDPELTNPNNIVVVDEDKFYVTNFAAFSNRILINLELGLRLPLGNVFYFDGNRFVKVLKNLQGPNGVAISPDKRHLYIAYHVGEYLAAYEISPNRSLTEISQVKIPSGLDNLNVDEQGRVLIGAQQILYQVIMHAQDPLNFNAPSQVLRVTFDNEHKGHSVEEIFADDGENLKGCTTAAVYKKTLLIGTLYDKAMYCQMSD